MDHYRLDLVMAEPDSDITPGTYRAVGLGINSKVVEVEYPHNQQWCEADRILYLLPDGVPKSIHAEISTEHGIFSKNMLAGFTHVDPNVYAIDNFGGVTANINFKNKTIVLTHDSKTSSSRISLKLNYRQGT